MSNLLGIRKEFKIKKMHQVPLEDNTALCEILLGHARPSSLLIAERIFRLDIDAIIDKYDAKSLNTMTHMTELARCLDLLGKHEEAEKLHTQNIHQHYEIGVFKCPHGESTKYLHFVYTVRDIAFCWQKQGMFEKAQKIIESTIPTATSKFGKGSEHVLSLQFVLAEICFDQKNYSKAEDLFRDMVALSEASTLPGEEVAWATLTYLNCLARSLQCQRTSKKAKIVAEKCLTLSIAKMGEDSPFLLTSKGTLGCILVDCHGDEGEDGDVDIGRAKDMLDLVVRQAETAHGPNHPLVLNTINYLAAAYIKKDDLVAAEKITRTLVQKQDSMCGSEHPNTLKALFYLGYILKKNDDQIPAEELFKNLIPRLELACGLYDDATLASLTELGEILSEKHDWSGVIQYLTVLVKRLEKSLLLNDPRRLGSALPLDGGFPAFSSSDPFKF